MPDQLKLSVDDYRVPARTFQHEIKIKASRFICTIVPCKSKEEAEKNYLEIKKKYYDANHNCLAFKIDEDVWRYSDDGEPSGTAGKPMLQSINGHNIYQILCVVTRYFGGTKLGTGGLIRAYGDAVNAAIESAPITIKTNWYCVDILFDYHFENFVRRQVNSYNAKIITSNYSADCHMQIAVPQSKMAALKKTLAEQSNQHIKIDDSVVPDSLK